tara:strand:- start:169 stop:681 length:513 start_codon:yes stop_codon:yes gene_type:complete
MSKSPTSAIAVANWFLEKCWSEKDVPQCDQLKLYKLVYYAHAWHLANGRGLLFDEDVEAWPHGPVVRDLYLEFKDAGKKPIRKLGTRLASNGGKFVLETPNHDGSLTGFFDSIWNVYKKHTGFELSNATHAIGEPWQIVAEVRDLSGKPSIPNELIEQVFKGKIDNRKTA